MAGLISIAQTAEVALVAATLKTALQIIAPTNQRLKIKSWGVFFDGVASTDSPIQVRLLRQTDAGTGGDALTPVLQVAGSETLQTTALSDIDSSEPTADDVIDIAEVHPQSGYEKLIPFDMPIEVPGGGRVGIECTAPNGVNVRAKIIFEE